MALALGLIVLLLFTILFHFYSPWWFTPLASNWGSMDDTIVLTFWVCGVVFIAISIFLIYCVIKFRYSETRRAGYEPENKSLEIWLTVITTIGVVALLAPGLKVWNDYINVPEEAHEVEALAQQWQWMFRYPGKDNKLGTAHSRHVTFDNPAGVNPDDPHGQDDIVIVGGQMHLPVDQPVKILLRSKDVLHDFYVPQFRAKMDIVPGLVSYLWLTPTRTGTFEIICAELCGVGHYNMRSEVVVDSEVSYQEWLDGQPTFAQLAVLESAASGDPMVEKGREVAQSKGCLACHSLDGSSSLGPSWKGMYGKTETLADGSTVIVDDDYIIESIREPNAKLVAGYAPVMPPAQLTDEEIEALIAFARSGSDESAGGDAGSSDMGSSDAGTSDAGSGKSPSADGGSGVKLGEKLAQQRGCIACHSLSGTKGVGPSWLGLAGAERELTNGEVVVATRDYLKLAISDPGIQVVEGFSPIMPPSGLNDEEIDAIVDYIETIQ